MPTPGDVTILLQQADQGDRQAADHLYRLVEEDLKAIARKRRQAFPSGMDASTILLVDEAFCQLVGQQVVDWQPGDRKKFYGFVAKRIHNHLVSTLRHEKAQKRGGDRQQVDWQDAQGHAFEQGDLEDTQLLLDLQTALDQFQEFAESDAILFRIRYFLNCTFEETAEIMDVSVSEAKRSFDRAKLWLRKELRSYHHDDTRAAEEGE